MLTVLWIWGVECISPSCSSWPVAYTTHCHLDWYWHAPEIFFWFLLFSVFCLTDPICAESNWNFGDRDRLRASSWYECCFFLLFWVTYLSLWTWGKSQVERKKRGSYERRKQTLQNGTCPLQVTFSQLTAYSPEHVTFWVAVHPNAFSCQCSFISLCLGGIQKKFLSRPTMRPITKQLPHGLVAFFCCWRAEQLKHRQWTDWIITLQDSTFTS